MSAQVLARATIGASSFVVFGVTALVLRDWTPMVLALAPLAALEWYLPRA
jgi:hypothetical protein